jgi:threonine aldolase
VAGPVVDLRSDTVTTPSAGMRAAIADAEVGDDGYGEDPTVRRLEETFARTVAGKDDAVLVPSGTMGNQIAMRLLARPGTAVVIGRRAHIVAYEQGAFGVNVPAQMHTIDDTDGTLDVDEVRWLIDAEAHHWLPVSAIAVENTHMPSGGRIWPQDRLAALARLGVPVHLDGARLLNAAVASGVAASTIAAPATTVMCCLSKGLGAPAGSLLAGPADLIAEARAERKRLGGAMRQVGVLAAAGRYALANNVERLAEDHARAARLAEAVGVADCPTNCVVFEHPDAAGVVRRLADEGVLAGTIGPGTIRLMTHLDVDDAGIERTLQALAVAGACT